MPAIPTALLRASPNRDTLRTVNLRLTRTPRLWWTRGLIAALLFLQLASAAYACSMGTARADAPSMAGMPCAQPMADGFVPALDADQPALCLEHCRSGSQAVDQGSPAPLPLPALMALFAVTEPAPRSADASAWRERHRSRERAPPPAHSILHCCYRI